MRNEATRAEVSTLNSRHKDEGKIDDGEPFSEPGRMGSEKWSLVLTKQKALVFLTRVISSSVPGCN